MSKTEDEKGFEIGLFFSIVPCTHLITITAIIA